jgi:hypothetical protein
MGDVRNAYNILVGIPEGKRLLGRYRCRWEDIIKTDLLEIGCGNVWTGCLWLRLRTWRATMNTVTFEKGLCFM